MEKLKEIVLFIVITINLRSTLLPHPHRLQLRHLGQVDTDHIKRSFPRPLHPIHPLQKEDDAVT